jgi:hypothetical protein
MSYLYRGWVGLGWAGLGWAGLGWAGLGWAGLGWVRLLGWVGYSSCKFIPFSCIHANCMCRFNLLPSYMAGGKYCQCQLRGGRSVAEPGKCALGEGQCL